MTLIQKFSNSQFYKNAAENLIYVQFVCHLTISPMWHLYSFAYDQFDWRDGIRYSYMSFYVKWAFLTEIVPWPRTWNVMIVTCNNGPQSVIFVRRRTHKLHRNQWVVYQRFRIHFTLGRSGKSSKQAAIWGWFSELMVNARASWCDSTGGKS